MIVRDGKLVYGRDDFEPVFDRDDVFFCPDRESFVAVSSGAIRTGLLR
jgi:hypothetical protein